MNARRTNALRWFVGLSLLAGSFALLAGAIGLQASSGPDLGMDALVVVAVLVLAVLATLERSSAWPPRWPWYLPALIAVGLFMVGFVSARFVLGAHLFLSSFAPFVAFLTGLGILARRPWAWPVAFASVTGFGPTILLFAGLPEGVIVGGFVLFVLDAVCLLALAPSFFEPSMPRT